VLGQERRLADERGQWSAQLVGDVRREAALACLRRGQRGDLGLESRRHLVERLCPRSELVATRDRKPRLEQSLGQRLRSRARAADGTKGAAGEHRAGETGEENEDSEPGKEDRAEDAQLVAQGLLGEEEIELCTADRPAHDEVVRARHRLALVSEIASPDEPPQVGRHLALADRDTRRERPSPVDHHREEIAAAFVGGEQGLCATRQVRRRDHEVAPRLARAGVDRVREQVVPHDEVRPAGECRRGDADGEHEGDRQPTTQTTGGDSPHQPGSRR
jgi:hypothetical protein